MRAIVFSELGLSDVLRLAERAPGVSGPSEVRGRIVSTSRSRASEGRTKKCQETS